MAAGSLFVKNVLKKSKMNRKHIPKNLKNSLGRRCEFCGCRSPAVVAHHVIRYAYGKSHESLVSLCKVHHEFVHLGLIENEKDDPRVWRLRVLGDRPMQFDVDKKWEKLRRGLL